MGHTIAHHTSLYRLTPTPLYRAGVFVNTEPKELPAGLQSTAYDGGRFARFTMTGGYDNLHSASARVMALVKERGIPVREGAFFMENYLDNPSEVAPEKLRTQILVPTTQ